MGFNGGHDLPHQNAYDLAAGDSHDSAAVLLDGGKVVAAIEQERLDRIKHSNKFPLLAMKACLDGYGARIQDVGAFAYYTTKQAMDLRMRNHVLKVGMARGTGPRPAAFPSFEAFLQAMLLEGFGHEVPRDRFHFVRHHITHLVSAFGQSGFDRSLILSIDAAGEGESGRVAVGEGERLEMLHVIRPETSLGFYYVNAIRYIGFAAFDEYKAMGLAPYGDPARFRKIFKGSYELLAGGDYTVSKARLAALFDVMTPRKRSDPFTQEHMDVAASLQEALEAIVTHVLDHYQGKTGQTKLCLAGGVAHNCTMNGKIAASGRFEAVFVQPASHDAGCALGAALATHYLLKARSPEKGQPTAAPGRRSTAIEHLYWGTDVGDAQTIAAALEPWSDLLHVERRADISQKTAQLIADGSAIGWVQGRSEFGPRALGNRSILADPRPEKNKQIINAMVKKREEFRPFAPSILEEDVHEYFDLGGMKSSPYMIFVVDVRPDKRSLLGAVTHVNGSARVQTVSRQSNEAYWQLIHDFKAITGVPVLLNTSFNNDAEPIVDSAFDAIVCFLTTKLNYLVIGDHLVSKKDVKVTAIASLVPRLLPHVTLNEVRRWTGSGPVTERWLGNNIDPEYRRSVSDEAFELLTRVNGEATLGELLHADGIREEPKIEEVLTQLFEIWSSRMIALAPRPANLAGQARGASSTSQPLPPPTST